MDEKDKQRSSVFDRLNPMTSEHLKPLSKYSLFNTREQSPALHQNRALPHPYVNFKVEVLNKNSCRKKKKWDATDSGYETPAKKVFRLDALSPDLGCVLDFSTPTSTQDSGSSSATSKFSLQSSSQSVSGEIITDKISSELQSQQEKLSVELANISETYTPGLRSHDAPSDTAPDFDCDVDDILCLNPAAAAAAVRLCEDVESCKSTSEHGLKLNSVSPSVSPSVALKQSLKEGQHWKVDEQQKEEKRRDDEEDKGYFSASYVKDLSPPGHPQLPFVTSSPRWGPEKAPEDESQPEPVKHVPFTEGRFCPIVSGPQLGSVHCPAELLGGDMEEVWDIGWPIFQSSLCQKTSGNLGPDGEGNVTDPILECQTTLDSAETTLESSHDSSFPWPKVKSVVVVPSQLNKPSSALPERRRRPVIFKTEEDLSCERRVYIHSVTQHLDDRQPADAVAELGVLMSLVADQYAGPRGERWQHPSDQTRRNYKKRFGNMNPKMRLSEWWARSQETHKSFDKIPKNQ